MGEQVAETFNFARDVMEQWARRRPHDPALWCVDEAGGARCYSFAELADRFRRASGFLHKAGIRCGDRVLVMLPRVPAWWIEMLGLIRLGAVPIPATTLLTAKDIAYRVQAAGITAILTDVDGAAKAVGFGGIVILDDELETGLAKTAADFEPAPTRPDDPGLLYFTSGTTGPPKMVLHTQASYGLAHRITGEAVALLQAARRALEPRRQRLGQSRMVESLWAMAHGRVHFRGRCAGEIRGGGRAADARALSDYHVVRAGDSAAAHRA